MPLLIKNSELATLRRAFAFYQKLDGDDSTPLEAASYSVVWNYRQFILALDNFAWNVTDRAQLDDSKAVLLSSLREFSRVEAFHLKGKVL